MRRPSIILHLLSLVMVLVACNGQPGGAPAATAQQPYQPPAWARGAVVYQLFVQVFTPEGTLAAATKRLPEVRALDVDIIMLLPVHPTGMKNRVGSHGSPYSIRDYRSIDPALGTDEEFRQFIQTAHQLGMHVIMDFVANHTAWDNPLITEHPDWYTHDSTGAIVSPNPSWKDVADLNYENAALRAYMIDTSLYWVDTFGIDGYRCDASVMVPDDFWKSWREALKTKHPDLLLLSESDPFTLYKAGFEVAYDWTTHQKFLLALKSTALASDLLDFIASEQGQDSIPVWRLRYLENHDQERIAKAARTPEQRELAAAFLLTLPGLPLIYAGQEIGADQLPSLFDWTKVNWSIGDEKLRETYLELIRLRKGSPALKEGTFEELKVEQVGVFAYERRAAGQRVVVALNFKETPADVKIEGMFGGRDLRTGEKVPAGGFELSGYGYRVIEAP